MDTPEFFIVDDDASVRKGIRRLLKSLKLSARAFESAEDFLRQVSPGTVGCLILDVRLPGMTGLQLQEQLVHSNWHVPIIFVTAHDDDESRETAMRQGAVAYLHKPFDREHFVESVNQAISRTLV